MEPFSIDREQLLSIDWHNLPEKTRRQIRMLTDTQKNLATLNNRRLSVFTRIQAYLAMSCCRLKTGLEQEGIPSCSWLAGFLHCDRTTVARMMAATNICVENYDLLLYLAAISPGPRPKQKSGEARRERVQFAGTWNSDFAESYTQIEYLYEWHFERCDDIKNKLLRGK